MGRVWVGLDFLGKVWCNGIFVWAKIQLLAAPPRAVRQVRPGSADLAKVLPSPGDARLVDAPGVVFREFGPGEHLWLTHLPGKFWAPPAAIVQFNGERQTAYGLLLHNACKIARLSWCVGFFWGTIKKTTRTTQKKQHTFWGGLSTTNKTRTHTKQVSNNKQKATTNNNQVIQAVTFWSPNVGGHLYNPLKGSRFNHPKKVTNWIIRQQDFCWMLAQPRRLQLAWHMAPCGRPWRVCPKLNGGGFPRVNLSSPLMVKKYQPPTETAGFLVSGLSYLLTDWFPLIRPAIQPLFLMGMTEVKESLEYIIYQKNSIQGWTTSPSGHDPQFVKIIQHKFQVTTPRKTQQFYTTWKYITSFWAIYVLYINPSPESFGHFGGSDSLTKITTFWHHENPADAKVDPKVRHRSEVVPVTEMRCFRLPGFSRWNQTWLVVFHQPIWKICSSKWVHLPQVSGWKFPKIFELQPPRNKTDFLAGVMVWGEDGTTIHGKQKSVPSSLGNEVHSRFAFLFFGPLWTLQLHLNLGADKVLRYAPVAAYIQWWHPSEFRWFFKRL